MTSTYFRSYYLLILLVYFSSCDATIANWIGSRGFKGSPESSSPTSSVLALTPTIYTLAVNNTRAFVASGGVPPYTYSVVSGGGSIGASSGIYIAGASAGSATIKVQDSVGSEATATITVNAGLSSLLSTLTQLGAPNSTDVLSQNIVSGGVPPYFYSTTAGAGTVNSSTGEYTLPASWLSTNVRVTDSVGNTTDILVEDSPVLVNGPIYSVAVNGTTAYLAGDFSRANPISATGLATINEADGSISLTDCNYHKKLNTGAMVYALETDGTHIFIGGRFTSYGGQTVGNIAKVNLATCELDTTFTQATGFAGGFADGAVSTMKLGGGSLFVGGEFATYRGAAYPLLVKLSTTTGNVDTTFNTGSSFNGAVISLAYSSGSIFVLGGSMTSYGGTTIQNLAKLNATTGALDTTFTQTTGLSSSSPRKIEIIGSSIYVCGALMSGYRGVGQSGRILKIDTTSGVLDTGFTVTLGSPSKCNDITTDGTSLYFAGEFSSINDGTGAVAYKHLGKVNATTGLVDATFTQLTGALATGVGLGSIKFYNNWIYVGGYLAVDSYRGLAVSPIFRLNPSDGSLDLTFTQNFGVDVETYSYSILGVGGGKIVLGGQFALIGGVPAMGLAKMDLTTNTIDTSFSSAVGFNGPVNKVLYSGTSLYVGGAFTSYRGAVANYLAKIDPTTGVLDTTFTQATGPNNAVMNILAVNSSIYFSGKFTTYRGSTALYLAKADPSTGNLDTTFTQATGVAHAFTPWVKSLATDGSALFVGGYFSSYRGSPALAVAKLNWTNGNLDTTFTQGTGLSGSGGYYTAQTFLYHSGSLYVGGSFNSYRGTTVQGIVKLNPTNGNLDTTFSQTTGASPAGLWTDGTALFLHGSFTSYRGTPVYGIAKVDPASGILDTTFTGSSGFAGGVVVYALISKSSSVLQAFGSFTSYRGKTVMYTCPISSTNGNIQ